MALNGTCRWCGSPLWRGKSKTGLCRSCLSQYIELCADIEHSDITKIMKQREYPRDTCPKCGGKKDVRAKQCIDCYAIVRKEQIREVGKRSYKGIRRRDTMSGTLPASCGRSSHGNSKLR